MGNAIHQLIEQYNVANSEAEKKLIKNQIHLQYYHASVIERKAVHEIMQPFLDEIEQEMLEKDLIAWQTYEIFNRFKSSNTRISG